MRMPDGGSEVYHCVVQPAYVGVLVLTADGYVPIVRQYRPAVETHTWEFPAGTLDMGETPEQAARREVMEEVGLDVCHLTPLGCFYPDTGRLQVDSYAFLAQTTSSSETAVLQKQLEVRYVTLEELCRMIRSLEFKHQLHLGIFGAALAHKLISF